MGTMQGNGPFRETSIAAVVIRADGTEEDLGVIARWHKNPLVRLKWWVGDLIKGRA